MEWSDEPVEGYWHVYSDGKRADIPFQTDEDKVFAWNSVAICAYRCGVTVLVVTINDTHFHVLVNGQEDRVVRFKNEFKCRLIRHYGHTGQTDQIGEGFFLAYELITGLTELKRKFMYVFRNCLDFFPMVPWEYPWGSGDIYFSRSELGRGRLLSCFTIRDQIAMLHSNEKLPQTWRMDERGALTPSSFIDYEKVEGIFVSARAFLAFLFVKKEDELEMKREMNRRYLEYRRMEDLRLHGNKLSHDYCGRGLKLAPFDIRLKVARKMLKDRTGFKSESLAKALYLKRDDLDRLL